MLCIKDNMQLRSPHGLWGMYTTDTPAYGKNSRSYSLDILIWPGSTAVRKSQDQRYVPCGAYSSSCRQKRSTSWILNVTCRQDCREIQLQSRRTRWDDFCPWKCEDLAACHSSVLPQTMWHAWIQMHWRATGSSSQKDTLAGVSMWFLPHLPR